MTSPESRFHYVLYPTDHQICSCEDCVRAADCRRGFEGSKQCSVRRGDSKGCCSEAWDSSKIINQVQLGKYFLWEPLWVTCFSEPSLSRVGFRSDFVVGLVWFSLVVKWNVMYFISYLLPFVLPLHTAQKGLVQLPSPPPTFLTRYLGTFLRSLLTYLFWRLNKAWFPNFLCAQQMLQSIHHLFGSLLHVVQYGCIPSTTSTTISIFLTSRVSYILLKVIKFYLAFIKTNTFCKCMVCWGLVFDCVFPVGVLNSRSSPTFPTVGLLGGHGWSGITEAIPALETFGVMSVTDVLDFVQTRSKDLPSYTEAVHPQYSHSRLFYPKMYPLRIQPVGWGSSPGWTSKHCCSHFCSFVLFPPGDLSY